MKTRNRIFWAFILNLAFSVFELIGGIFTRSVSIISDSVHDLGDAVSMGCAYFLEKKSEQAADDTYTFGYGRYSPFGALISGCVLLVGGIFTVLKSVGRIISGGNVNGDGMIVLAIVGLLVNLLAAYFTAKGRSENQRTVHLHMLEDVLGWAVVLIGAIIIRFTGFYLIDPIISLAVSVFIIFAALRALKDTLGIFLEKAPGSLRAESVSEVIRAIEGIKDVHHVHLWSLDGERVLITMHVVTDEDSAKLKADIRDKLNFLGISHATLEFEKTGENCTQRYCNVDTLQHCKHCSHGHPH